MTNARRQFITQSSKAGLLFLIAPQLIACKDKAKVQEAEQNVKEVMKAFNLATNGTESYKINHVSGNFWSFEERGGTIGIYASEDGICIVDTQFPEQSKHVVEAVRKITDRKIDILINTHHHGDHTSGNPVFKDLVGLSIAHENSIKNQRNTAESKGNLTEIYLPETSYDTEWETKLGKETIRMRYYGPGHTNGDSVTTFINANAVHMGDLVFNRRFPYIDKSTGASISNWVTVLDRVIQDHNAETKYIFGHSDNGFPIQGTQEDLRAFQNYLEKLLEFGERSKKAGKSLEEVKKETTIIPGAEEWKGDGIERSLDALYAEMN